MPGRPAHPARHAEAALPTSPRPTQATLIIRREQQKRKAQAEEAEMMGAHQRTPQVISATGTGHDGQADWSAAADRRRTRRHADDVTGRGRSRG